MSGIIVITGSRELRETKSNPSNIVRILDTYRSFGYFELYHGGCRGADTVVSEFARHKFKITVFPADWNKGSSAGPIRNGKMLDAAVATDERVILIAFPVKGSTNKGTWDCIRQAFFRMVNTRIFWMENAQ